jgi:hypothetical protein
MDNNGEFLLFAVVKVATSSGVSAKKELFRQIGADVLRYSNREVAEQEPHSSI